MVYESSLQRIVLVAPLIGCLGILLRRYLECAAKGRKHLPYPPGPKALPILGNLFDFPAEYSWLALTKLSKKHGEPLVLQFSPTEDEQAYLIIFCTRGYRPFADPGKSRCNFELDEGGLGFDGEALYRVLWPPVLSNDFRDVRRPCCA